MIELIFIFIFGLIIGSFLNCVIWRLYKEESFLWGKSYCPHCHHHLGFFDLFPLLSFVFLKGRCRYCKGKISWQYPLVELATAIAFVCIYLYFQPVSLLSLYYPLQLVFWWAMASFFIIIFVFDLKYYIVPDEVVYPAIILSIAWLVYSFCSGFMSGQEGLMAIAVALLAALLFFLLWFFSKGMAMGFGDVKLALFVGLALGYPDAIVGIFLGFLFGAIIGTAMVFLKKKGFKSEVPFAPFLVAGAATAAFFGSNIVNWYLSLSI